MCELNHAKTDIFTLNNKTTFEAAIQLTGAYRLADDTKPILLWNKLPMNMIAPYYLLFIHRFTLAVSFDNVFLSHRYTQSRSPPAVSLLYYLKHSPFPLVFRMP